MNDRRVFAALSNGSRATRASRAAGACALAALLPSMGCSPWATAVGAQRAERWVRAAEQAQAEQSAVYELTLSRLYLSKAREEAGEAHYAFARRLLERAEQNARKAVALAESRGARP